MNKKIRSYFSTKRSSVSRPAVILPTPTPTSIPTSTPTSVSRGSSVSQHLHAVKEILKNATSDAEYVRNNSVPYVG